MLNHVKMEEPPLFIPIIHSDSKYSKPYIYVKEMVQTYIHGVGSLVPPGDKNIRGETYYEKIPYDTLNDDNLPIDDRLLTRSNREERDVYLTYMDAIPAPTHVIVITGNSVRMSAIYIEFPEFDFS